ncbi:hypothetical protein DS885_16380 [Psychromonas sp. B3M02]|uniref:DUF6776 family protein n=1 Tax=Psychromonas sp. B3M02 TaxID=2267226 RepID=UPI000DEBDF47|nr:DUF6776 family protein [Psychromonas sp. B3M02]RBW41605.1 hypothetical protein DS885_16380 [Psychromonas sp. B3M02]
MKQFKISFLKWLVISLICIYFGFMVGKFKQDILQHKVQSLALDVESLTLENTQLTERLNLIQADYNSEKQVHSVLEKENLTLNNALDASNNKLYFYEQVVAPELSKAGLNIYSFDVTAGEEQGTWLFEVVLMQGQKGRHELNGKVEITFASADGDQKISLKDLNTNFDSAFKFKYFQHLKGSFTLPEQATVEQIFVVAEAKASKWSRSQRIEKVYDWKNFIEDGATSLEELATQSE